MALYACTGRKFRATLSEIKKKIEPTKEFHEKYKRGDFFESICGPLMTLKTDKFDMNQVNMYQAHQPFHSLIDGLRETGTDKKIGEKEFNFMLMEPAERGFIFAFNYDEQLRILKPYQSADEDKVAQTLSDDGIGPKVFALGERWLVEECVLGPELTKVYKKMDADLIGKIIGHVYGRLHKNKVVYAYGFDNVSFQGTIDEGPRHIILTEESPKIIDFGIAKIVKTQEYLSRDTDTLDQYFTTIFKDKELETIRKSFKEAYEHYKTTK